MSTYTRKEIATHNTVSDCWVIIEAKVYNVTTFLEDHPGGKRAILMYAGKDATKEFKMVWFFLLFLVHVVGCCFDGNEILSFWYECDAELCTHIFSFSFFFSLLPTSTPTNTMRVGKKIGLGKLKESRRRAATSNIYFM